MNMFVFILINVVMLIVLLFGLYLCGRVFIPILAERDTFFSSPKLGRVKARRRSGRIVGFFANIVGKDRHVNKRTGKIEPGEEELGGFWWQVFGAYFIGLDEVYRYEIATGAVENGDGRIEYEKKEASSIFVEGSYPLTAQFVTRDGVRLKVRLQLKLSTIDAAKGLSLPLSWTIPVFAAVLGKSRDFFGSRDIGVLISAQNEGRGIDLGGAGSSDYVREILSLNTPKVGNIPLEELCGQRIDAVNLIDIDFADLEAKKAFLAPFVAGQEAQKQVRDARAYAEAIMIKSEAEKHAAANVAQAIKAKGEAEAGVYGKKRESLGDDPKATAQVIVAEKQSEMENLTTLVNGGNSMVAIPVPPADKKGKPK